MAGATVGEVKLGLSFDGKSVSNSADKVSKDVGSKLSGVAKTIGKAFTVATTAAATGVLAFGKSSVSAGMQFDSSMSQVAATMGTTVDQIGSLRDLALEMGSKTAFSANEAAEALNYMALAGYDAETSTKMLPNVLNLAAAGNMELATASDMVTDSQSALGLSLEQTETLIDQMAKTASKSNTSVEQLGSAILTVGGTAKNLAGGTTELNAALGILADNGIKGAEGGTALRNIILSLSAPTDKAAEMMRNLGLEVYDAEGNMRPLNDVFNDLNGIMSDMTQGEQTEVLNTIFNKVDLKSANALLANSGERFNELTEAINNAEGAAKDMAAVQLDNLEGDITLFKSALEGAKISISDSLTPALREFTQFGTNSITQLAEAFQNGGLSGAAEALGNIFAEGASIIISKLPDFVNCAVQIVNAVSAQLPTLIPLLVDSLVACIPTLLDGAVQLLMAIVEALPVVIDALVAALPGIINALVNTLTSPSFLTQLLNAAIQLLMSLVRALPQIITALVDALPMIIENVIAFLTNPSTIGMLLNAAVQLFFALVQAVPQILGSLLGALGSILNSVFGRIGEFFGTIFGALTEWLGSLLAPVGEFFGSVFGKIGEFVGFLGEVMGNIFNVVTAPIQAIWGFIQNIFILIAAVLATVAEWVYNTVLAPIVNFVTGVINTIVSGVTGFVSAVQSIIGVIANWVNSNVIQPIANFFSGLWNGVQAGVNAFANVFRSVFEGIKNFVSGVVNNIKGFFEGLWNGIKAGVEAVKGAISNVFSAIGGIIKAPINGIIGAINGVINTINGITVPDWVPVIGGAHTNFPTIPTLAHGGFADGATTAIIGEAGAEAVLPLEQNTDNWSGLLADTLLDAMEERETPVGGGQTVIFNITNTNGLDEQTLSNMMLRKMREIA